nr:DUF4236 domain-containing protein [Desulfosporosinus sp. FKB]
MGPFRLNFSKRGVGVSAGVKGARVGIGLVDSNYPFCSWYRNIVCFGE